MKFISRFISKNIDEKNDYFIKTADGEVVDWCMFCGSKIGQKSERNNKKVKAIFCCHNCCKHYCDQCSYSKKIQKENKQFCLRCESEVEQVHI